MTNGSGALCGLCAGCGISRSISVAGTSYHCSQFLNNWSELSVEAALTHSALVPCVESPSFVLLFLSFLTEGVVLWFFMRP